MTTDANKPLALVTTAEAPTTDLSTLSNWNELLARADYFSKSQLVPQALRGKPHDIAIILQMGFELDLPPMQSIGGITVINGTPGVSPQLALALIRSRVPGSVIQFKTLSENEAVVFMARSRETLDEGYTATWNDAKAKAMGLLDKPNYKMQKGNMLKWRAVGEAARAVFSDVLKGLYLDVELEDLPAAADDKAARIAAKIAARNASAPATQAGDMSKVIETTGAVLDQLTDEAVADIKAAIERSKLDELGDYVVTFGRKLKDKRLADIEDKEIESYIEYLVNSAAEQNKDVSPQAQEFIDKANAYLEERRR